MRVKQNIARQKTKANGSKYFLYELPEIQMEEEIRLKALKPIRRMLELSAQLGK